MVRFYTSGKTNPYFSVIVTYTKMCYNYSKVWVLLTPNLYFVSRDKECVANHMRTVENVLHKVL